MGADVTKVLPKSSHLAVMISPCFHWNSRCFSLLSTIFPIKIPMEGHFFPFFHQNSDWRCKFFVSTSFFARFCTWLRPSIVTVSRMSVSMEEQGDFAKVKARATAWFYGLKRLNNGAHISTDLKGFGLVQQRRSLDLPKFVSVFLKTVWDTLGEYLGALNPADTKRLRFNQVPLRKPTWIPQEELI